MLSACSNQNDAPPIIIPPSPMPSRADLTGPSDELVYSVLTNECKNAASMCIRLYFNRNEDKITTEAQQTVNHVAKMVNSRTGIKIVGSAQSTEDNYQALATARASNVASALKSNGYLGQIDQETHIYTDKLPGVQNVIFWKSEIIF